MNQENLRILGEYLISLPNDYDGFDMGDYCKNPNKEYVLPRKSECGTVACALGHAPRAGIKPRSAAAKENWEYFCDEALDIPFYSDEGLWCFSGEWDATDNTPQGAGKRIFWLLEHGVPEDWEEQIFGEADLCYESGAGE